MKNETSVYQSISVEDMLGEVDTTIEGFINGEKTIDENSLEKAPNIIEWIIGDRYLAQPELFKYKRQYQVLRDFFQLRCPVCNPQSAQHSDVWDKSKDYLESEVLLVWSEKEKDDVCPKCGWTRREFEKEEVLKRYNTMVGCAGMRSGKSMTAGFIASWVEHNCIVVDNLQRYFDVINRQRLECAFVATTGTQAKDTIYDTYTTIRDGSPWLQSYIKKVKAEQVREDSYKEYPSGSIEHRNKRLFMMSLNSNSSGLAGRTRVAGFIDELSRFDLSESKRSADEIFSVINHSLLTVRAASRERYLPNWVGLMVCVSSPISESDKTMQLLTVSKKDKTMFTFHYATTDFNPKITQEDLQPEYDKDEVKAERDFGANPPGAENPLIIHWEEWFNNCCDVTRKSVAEFSFYHPRDQFGQEYVATKLTSLIADKGHNYYISIDAGKSGDSFAFAMGHGEYIDTPIGDMFVTCLDLIFHLKPQRKPIKRLAYFLSIPDVVKDIKKKLKIKAVQYDHWQSEHQIQELRNVGIWADAHNLNVNDYENLMRDGYTGLLKLLPPTDDINQPLEKLDAETRFWKEAKQLERSRDLKKVDHPDGGSNDLIQVVCGVHRSVQLSRTIENEEDRFYTTGKQKRAKTRQAFQRFTDARSRLGVGDAGRIGVSPSRWQGSSMFRDKKREDSYPINRNQARRRK